MNQNPFLRTAPAAKVIFVPAEAVHLPAHFAGDQGNPAANPTQKNQGLSSQDISNIAGIVSGVLNTTSETILGIVQSNNQVRIAELNADAATALRGISNQLGLGGQTPEQRAALEQQQNALQALITGLARQRDAPMQQDNTAMYVGLAAVGAILLYMATRKPEPAAAPARRNPVRRRRRRNR